MTGSMTQSPPPKAAKAPCKSCPYRRDAPVGLWAKHEYEKLPEYDKPTYAQPMGLFMCHSEPESLCSGWVGCHDVDHLLALRIARVDPSVYDYESPIPLFSSGQEAAEHGISGIDAPDVRALSMMPRLERKIAKRKG